jgi:peptidoglycan/LPS O-acetylase OafA/YrhL
MSGLYKLLYRFDFETAHWDARVAALLALIWVLILVCAISSIRSQQLSPGQQRLWITVVTLVPVIGLLAYLPFSVKRDDMPHYFRFRPKDRHRGGGGSRSEGKKSTRADDAR